MKQRKFKKGDVCLVKDLQEFGEVLMQLYKPIDKNIKGEPIPRIWECFVLDAEHQGFLAFREDHITEYWRFTIFEKELILIEGKT